MANLTELNQFDPNVYRIDQTDPVKGWDGTDLGISNQQAQALANRTQWLKARVDLGARITGFDTFTPPSSGAALNVTPDQFKGKHIRFNLVSFDALMILPPAATVPDNGNLSMTVEPGPTVNFYQSNNRFVEITPSAGDKIYLAETNQELDQVFLPPYTTAVIHKLSSNRFIMWRTQSVDQAPPGMIVAWAANTIPYGWLECNGASLSRATYASLYANIGLTFGNPGSTLFKLPDLRGEFIRGWDNGRGIDTGRTFGSTQTDDFKSHEHQLVGQLQAFSPAAGSGKFTLHGGVGSGANTDYINNTGGTETRPRNIAMMYIIKF